MHSLQQRSSFRYQGFTPWFAIICNIGSMMFLGLFIGVHLYRAEMLIFLGPALVICVSVILKPMLSLFERIEVTESSLVWKGRIGRRRMQIPLLDIEARSIGTVAPTPASAPRMRFEVRTRSGTVQFSEDLADYKQLLDRLHTIAAPSETLPPPDPALFTLSRRFNYQDSEAYGLFNWLVVAIIALAVMALISWPQPVNGVISLDSAATFATFVFLCLAGVVYAWFLSRKAKHERIEIDQGSIRWTNWRNRVVLQTKLGDFQRASFQARTGLAEMLFQVNTGDGVLRWSSRLSHYEEICAIARALTGDYTLIPAQFGVSPIVRPRPDHQAR